MSTVDIDLTKHVHDDGHHDDHHHDEHHDSFITKYIFTTDHKMIAKQFLITGIISFNDGSWPSIVVKVRVEPGSRNPRGIIKAEMLSPLSACVLLNWLANKLRGDRHVPYSFSPRNRFRSVSKEEAGRLAAK